MAIFGAEFPVFHEPETPPWLQGMAINKELIAKDLANRQASINNQISGVQQRYAEPNAQQSLLKAILENRYLPQEKAANIAHTSSLTNRVNQMLPMELEAERLKNQQAQREYNNPLYGSTETKQIAALQDAGVITPEKAKELVQHVANNMQSSKSGFKELPADYKAAYLSTLENAGYNHQEALHHALNDDDLGDMLQAKGFQRDMSDLPSSPSVPTGATRTRLQRSNTATAEINYSSPFIDKGIAHYSGQPTIKGTPLGFYKDAIMGLNKDAQSDFIAASTLGQEEAFLRAAQAGAPLSQGLLNHTLNTSLMDKKASFPFVKPEVFLEAAEKIRKQFAGMNKAANQAAYKTGAIKSDESDGRSPQNKKFMREVEEPANDYSEEDITHTAKLKGISPEKVRAQLQARRSQ